ncbi:Uncharacterised protein [Pseudomonas aeruginosa]|nr:Uncharacterised protein [Pseudomonas aeruginosa]
MVAAAPGARPGTGARRGAADSPLRGAGRRRLVRRTGRSGQPRRAAVDDRLGPAAGLWLVGKPARPGDPRLAPVAGGAGDPVPATANQVRILVPRGRAGAGAGPRGTGQGRQVPGAHPGTGGRTGRQAGDGFGIGEERLAELAAGHGDAARQRRAGRLRADPRGPRMPLATSLPAGRRRRRGGRRPGLAARTQTCARHRITSTGRAERPAKAGPTEESWIIC